MNTFGLKVGNVFKGRYEITAELGEGGFAKVYRAIDTELKREVAIKFLKFSADQSEADLERFYREAKTLAQLEHPNIVKVYSVDLDDDRMPFIVMEYLQGMSLQKLILDKGALGQDRVKSIFSQVCSGLDYAHKLGVIHRDLSPANIFLLAGPKTDVRIIDFGLSKLMKSDSIANGALTLTQTGALIGNPVYMSPEQCSGQPLDQRADLYSLGCVLYEAICGKPPFACWNPIGLLQQQQLEYPPAPELNWQNDDLSFKIKNITLKCLQKNKNKRYQSAVEVQKALLDDNIQNSDGSEYKSLDPWMNESKPKNGLPVRALLSVVLLIALGAAGLKYGPIYLASALKSIHSDIFVSLEESLAAFLRKHDENVSIGLYRDLLTYESVKANCKKHQEICIELAKYLRQKGDCRAMCSVLESGLNGKCDASQTSDYLSKTLVLIDGCTFPPDFYAQELLLRCRMSAASDSGDSRPSRFLLASLDSLFKNFPAIRQRMYLDPKVNDEEAIAVLLPLVNRILKKPSFEPNDTEKAEFVSLCDLTINRFPRLAPLVLECLQLQLQRSDGLHETTYYEFQKVKCLELVDKRKAEEEALEFVSKHNELDPVDGMHLLIRAANLASKSGNTPVCAGLLDRAERLYLGSNGLATASEGPKFFYACNLYCAELAIYSRLGDKKACELALSKLAARIRDAQDMSAANIRWKISTAAGNPTRNWFQDQRVHQGFMEAMVSFNRYGSKVQLNLCIKRYLEMLLNCNGKIARSCKDYFYELENQGKVDLSNQKLIQRLIERD